MTVNFEIPTNVSWIKANVNASGYYRVNYEPAIWSSLTRLMTSGAGLTVFSPADRAQLLDDAFSLAWAGVLNVTVPLTLSQYLVNETEYLPWSTALTHLRKLDTLLSIRTARRSLHCFVRNLVTPLYSVLGWTAKTTHIQRYIINQMCTIEIKHLLTVICIQKQFTSERSVGSCRLFWSFKCSE